jgi:RNA polymerase sigma-70 factor (ECF subfamily)
MFLGKSHSDLSDEALLLRFRNGGEQSILGELFVRYSSLVYGVCLKYLKARDIAKDAVMQIFETLPAKLQNHEIAHFRGWLYVTCRNHCLMYLRSEKRHKSEEIGPHHMENDPVWNLGDEEPLEGNLGKLERCIEELGDEQKACVREFFIQEKSYKEISTSTGMDLKKVKSHIQNGKRNLKICMERNE